MSQFLIFIVVMLSALSFLAKAELYIVQPYWLKETIGNNGRINASLGNYGHLQYGASQMAKVFYPKSNQDGCKEFKVSDFDDEDQEDSYFKDKPCLLVKRGGCAFVTKSLNIQKFGGSIALIADNIKENEQDIIMIDQLDEGDQVRIPTYLINSADGDALMKASIALDIVIKSSLEIGHTSNFINFELWYGGPFDFLDYNIMEVQDVLVQLQNYTMMKPRTYTWSCEGIRCSQQLKKEFCVSNGKYCPMMPLVHLANNSIIKERLITEVLIEKCLYEYSLDQSNVLIWFTYMKRYLTDCYQPDKVVLTNITHECSNKILADLKVDIPLISECVNNSFDTPGDFNSDNKLLAVDRKLQKTEGVRVTPQITIEGGFPYRGEFDSYDLKNAICAGFKRAPKQCKGYPHPGDQELSEKEQSMRRRRVIFAEVAIAVILVLIINIAIICLFRLYQKNKRQNVLKLVINNEVSKYFKISATENSATDCIANGEQMNTETEGNNSQNIETLD